MSYIEKIELRVSRPLLLWRALTHWLERYGGMPFGQPVTVENRSGAAGNIGADAVFKAPPDGHTLLFTQPAPLVVNKALYGKLTFEPEQFVPIALVSIQDIMLAVNPKVPASSLPEQVEQPVLGRRLVRPELRHVHDVADFLDVVAYHR